MEWTPQFSTPPESIRSERKRKYLKKGRKWSLILISCGPLPFGPTNFGSILTGQMLVSLLWDHFFLPLLFLQQGGLITKEPISLLPLLGVGGQWGSQCSHQRSCRRGSTWRSPHSGWRATTVALLGWPPLRPGGRARGERQWCHHRQWGGRRLGSGRS